MKITAILLLAACLQVGASGYAQTITLSLKNAPLEEVFKEIKKQTDYSFIFTREEITKTKPVNIDVLNAALKEVLALCFHDQPLTYTIIEKYIILKKAPDKLAAIETVHLTTTVDVSGIVLNEEGSVVPGATITIKNTKFGTATDERGEFFLPGVSEDATLVITSVGYKTEEVKVMGKNKLKIRLQMSVSNLDETVVIAYGTTTRRLNTGSVGKVTAQEIANQPVSNPLAALQGRIPGLIVTQTSGIPGASFEVTIRGRSSLDLNISQNNPLYVVDGVPFEMGNNPTNQIVSAANNPIGGAGGLSAFNSINPSDIESMEVLKDADATAIYGSRGANGVILITTKKGSAGKTKTSFKAYTGRSKVTRMMDMMNTPQYVQMRKEAFNNDGKVPTFITAPDILLWDTTRYTDFKELLIGGAASTNDIQASVSGGNGSTSFLLANNFHKETTVFPGDLSDQRISINLGIRHNSENKKFKSIINGIYSKDVNRLISFDLSQYLRLPPNLLLYDSLGNLNWQEKGIDFSNVNGFINPLSELLRKYKSVNEVFSGNVNFSYEPIGGLFLRANIGYNLFNTDEQSIRPKSSISPGSSSLASSRFANATTRSWITEPQLEYHFDIAKGKTTLLLGSTFQEKTMSSTSISANNYSSDLMLYSIPAAGNVSVENYGTTYRYNAFFGRINYNWQNKYIMNVSARRDGSSRFGPKQRFQNFWASGFGWIFTNEAFIKNNIPVLSFGKLRASYGITGNDQIGDYKYLDIWNNTFFQYQNSPGLFPIGLFNPAYTWERTKKFEAAIELGLLNDLLLFSVSHYRHRSGNQLINFSLPIQTGFSSVIKNLPALVQNSGWEIAASKKNQLSKNLKWSISFNLTIPSNKLISFPGLEETSYFTSYKQGASLSLINRLRYTGIDPATGIYTFQDLNQDSLYTSADYQSLGDRDPEFYGGLENSFSYKQFNLTFLFQFTKQIGENYLSNFYTYVPGNAYNQPLYALNRWQKPGDNANVQRYTTLPTDPAAIISRTKLRISNGIYTDASFIRLKNISLSYNLPPEKCKKWHIVQGGVFLHIQNLLTITNFIGADPESQSFFQLPPLRTFAGGIQLTF